ncbi:hypothetical protein [Antarctobacter sp.]|uniref:hypothetical protein n=1 Tax=Antarctobacter sp. TaxID=1872577 RepID=UPI002B273AD5|nr:hypothetical protein [Antarctobacter sp.]
MTYVSRIEAPADELERLLFYMPILAERATNTWAQGFATSIVKQSRRRNWCPSQKQLPMMRRLVAEMFAYGNEDEECPVIE